MKLFSYFRSSASYRVRIALNLKGLAYEVVPVHLLKGGGEQLAPAYRALSPDGLVPVLLDRAWVRSLALSIACDIHPLNNLRVLRYLTQEMKVSEEEKNRWYRHWCEQGLAAIESVLAHDPRVGIYCFGTMPTLADCCLIPQVANAQRLQCDLSAMPTILRINAACMALESFRQASPANQPDAE